jgi:hypothetical protein
MSREIEHEIRDMVLRGLKMGQDVYVHPRANEGWTEPLCGTITGWCTGWGPDMVDVRIGDHDFHVRRFDVISAEQYDAVQQWQDAEVTA